MLTSNGLSMADNQGREALSVIHINVPRAMKARWVKASQARGQKLTDWIIERLEGRTMNVYPIPEALASKYHGAGHALAAVVGGQVVDLVYVEDALPGYDPDEHGALAVAVNDDRIAPTVRRMQALGQVSVGMCSAWEFVEL